MENMYTTACLSHQSNSDCCSCRPVESPLQKGLRERRERLAHLHPLARYEYRCKGCWSYVWTDGDTQFLSETTTPCKCMAVEVEVDEPVPPPVTNEEGEDTEWWRK